ncbi:MAG: choice-of-anchor D domain-containing protein, partial [Pirellula sp.]
RDAAGNQLDGEFDGQPGGSYEFNFRTVSLTSLPGTTLSGIVADPGPDLKPGSFDDLRPGPDGVLMTGDDIYLLPIANAKVFILGLEDQYVFTDAQGRFSFDAVPSGNVKLAVDGRTAFNPPSGIFFPEMVMDLQIEPGVANNVMRSMQRDPMRQATATMVGVYLPRLVSSILQTTSDVQTTTIGVLTGAAPHLTEQERQLLTLTIPPGVAIGEDGQVVSQPQIGISTVPAELVREMLPQGLLQHTFDITIQAPGVSVFSTPIPFSAPNLFNAAPGTQLNFLSFDHTTGRLVIEGTGTVSQDGKSILTNPGEGITHPGWTGFIPPGSPAGGGGPSSGPGPGPGPGGPPCSPPPPPPTGPGQTHEEDPIVLPMIFGEDGMLKHDKLQWTGPGDNGPPGSCSSNPQSSLYVQIEVDGPLGEFMERTGSQGLGSQSFGFTGSEKKSFEGKAIKYDKLFKDGFKDQLQDHLYGSKIKITEIRGNGDGSSTRTIRTFLLYRWVDVVDATKAQDRTGSTAAFHKTLADGSGAFIRDKYFEVHLPTSMDTTFLSGNDDFLVNRPVRGEGVAFWQFDPDSAGTKTAQIDLRFEEVSVGKLEAIGTDIAPTTVNLNLFGGKGSMSYSEELQRVILALEGDFDVIYKYTASGPQEIASDAFESLFNGFMPVDRKETGPDGKNKFTDDQLTALRIKIASEAVLLGDAIRRDYEPINGGYSAYQFVESGGDVTMVWEDRFSKGAPVFGSAEFDADTVYSGLEDQNGDDLMIEFVFANKNLPLGAKIWATSQNLNSKVKNTGGFAVAINIPWEGNTSFADFVANTVSHEIGHTFGLKDAYSNPTQKGGRANCNKSGNCTPFDIMRSGSNSDGDLTFLPQNIALLQMAMGIHQAPELLRPALQQYADTVGLPTYINGVDLTREMPSNEVKLPEIALIRPDIAFFGRLNDMDTIGSIPADGLGGLSVSADYQLLNAGTADLVITSVELIGRSSGFTLATTELAGTVLISGQSTTVRVTFDPSIVGAAEVTLRIVSNASLTPVLDLLVKGTGTPHVPTAELKLVGSGNLGGVAVAEGQSENLNFAKITNHGVEPLLVSDIRIMQGNSAFSLIGVPVDLSTSPIALALGESFTFGVQFDPLRLGIDRAFIEVTTNDTEQPTLRVTAVGTGVPAVLYPDLGRDFVAIEATNTPLRTISDDGGNFDFFLPDQEFYHMVVFDPDTGLVSHGSGLTGPSGQFVDLTRTLVFGASADADTDGDGLPNDVEFAIGSSPNNTDTDGDGVDDFLDVSRGSGLVAGASVPGVARSIVVEASQDLNSSFAYVASSPINTPGGLYVVDVSDPNQPITVGGANLAGAVSDVAVNTQLQMAIVPAGTSGVHLVDVSNPFRPIRRVTLIVSPEVTLAETYADRAYLTSGDDLISLDLPTRTVLETFVVGGTTLTDIGREGSTLYTIELADLTSRLRLFDVSTDAIVARGSLLLPSAALGHAFVGAGILYVPSRTIDGGQGFATIDVSNPDLPTVISGTDNISFGFASSDVAYSGSGRLLAAGAQFNQSPSLDVLDFSDPTDTDRFINRFTLSAFPGEVAIANGLAFVAGGASGLLVANFHLIDNLGLAPMVTIAAQVTDSDLGQPGMQVSSGASIPISANVVEDVQTKHAELLLNGQVVARDLSFPFEFPFVAPQVSTLTPFQLQVRVTDTANSSSLSNLLSFEAVPSNLHILATFPEPDSVQTFDINAVAMAFDKPISNSSLLASNFLLVGDGGDNSFGTSDDVPVVFDRVLLDLNATFPIVRLERDLPLPLDRYRVTVLADNVMDSAGNRLDGEFGGLFPTGDGTPGGNMVFTFTASRVLESIPDGAFPTRRLRMVELAENEKLDDKFNTISGGALDTRGNGNVLIVDVNGDSRPDIVRPSFGTIYELNGAVTQSRTFDAVGVRVQRPDGTYDEPVNFEVGSHPRSVIAGDVNGDGFLDLVTVNVEQALISGVTQVGFDLSILLGDGFGGFAPEIRQDTGRTIASNLFELPRVVLGQFTADTNLEVGTAGVENVNLPLTPGVEITGSITV